MDYTIFLAIWMWGLIPAFGWVIYRVYFTPCFPNEVPAVIISWLVWPITIVILIYVAIVE